MHSPVHSQHAGKVPCSRDRSESYAQEQKHAITEEESAQVVTSNTVLLTVSIGLQQLQVYYKYYSNINFACTLQITEMVLGLVIFAYNPSLNVQVIVLCYHIHILALRIAIFYIFSLKS